MRALVLGGNGFIGTHVVDALLSKGHFVRVFDRTPERYRQPLLDVDYRLASFDDIPSLLEAMQGVDVVYHLISTTVPGTSNKDPIYDIESNLVGTVRLLNLMRDSGVKRIVYLSSGGTVYGIPEVCPIPEPHPLRPICSYGVVKVAIENYLQMYQHLYGIEAVILRASNPYGERQGHAGVQGLIGTIMDRMITNQRVEIWGDGSIVRDYIYVRDLAELCALVAQRFHSGVYNVGSGEGKTINEVIDVFRKVAKQEVNVSYTQGRSFDIPSVVLDISKVKAEFNWSPCTPLYKGLQMTWEWMQRQIVNESSAARIYSRVN